MKRLLIVLINLLGFTSPSFSMDPIDEPLVELGHGKMLLTKVPEDFRRQNPQYQGISKLHSRRYPKIPIIRPYNNTFVSFPFAACLPKAHASKLLEDIHAQQLPGYTKVYSFTVQSIADEKADGIERLHSLKPHYFMHPNAPLDFEGKEFLTPLRWTALPGARGYVEPAQGSIQTAGLLADSVFTHPLADGTMVVSGDVMHLRGIYYHRKSVDMSSLVAFTDEQGRNIAAITYHWLLNKEDEDMFWDVILNKKTQTFRDLINSLEDKENFKDFLAELKTYVGITAKQQDVADTYHSIKKLGNPLSDEEIIKYVLKTKNYTDWDDLSPEAWIQSMAEFISKAELREVEGLLRQQDYAQTYRILRGSGNTASDEVLIEYLLEEKGYKNWAKLLPADKADIVSRIAPRTEIRKLEGLLHTVADLYDKLKRSGNSAKDEDLIKYILEKNGYTSWDTLTSTDRAQYVAEVISSIALKEIR